MYEDEDNDGRFPDESPVEVRHLRSKQEEQGERGGPDDPFHDGGHGLRRGRLRGGGFSLPYLRPGPSPRAGRHGGPDAAAERGRIIAASLVLLHEARNDRDAPGLARFMLWLGISATIGTNVVYGAGYGLLGALISARPAVAFIGAVEIAMQLVRRSRGPRAPAVPAVPGDVPEQECATEWMRMSSSRS